MLYNRKRLDRASDKAVVINYRADVLPINVCILSVPCVAKRRNASRLLLAVLSAAVGLQLATGARCAWTDSHLFQYQQLSRCLYSYITVQVVFSFAHYCSLDCKNPTVFSESANFISVKLTNLRPATSRSDSSIVLSQFADCFSFLPR